MSPSRVILYLKFGKHQLEFYFETVAHLFQHPEQTVRRIEQLQFVELTCGVVLVVDN